MKLIRQACDVIAAIILIPFALGYLAFTLFTLILDAVQEGENP